MKKLLIILIAVSTLFISCNPDSSTSIIFDKMHANPSSDYRIYNYVGDYTDSEGHMNLVLGTNLGIMLYDITTMGYSIIVEPIARPLMVVGDYIIYYQQNRGETATLKAAKLSGNGLIPNEEIYDATFSIGSENNLFISNAYLYTDQSASGTSITYTVQVRQTPNETPSDREITFYRFEDDNISTSITPDNKFEISVGTASRAIADSSDEIAPYIVGDGYIAYLDENESYRDVYDIRSGNYESEIINWNSSNRRVATCPDSEIIAYFGSTGNTQVLVDNSGNIFTKDSSSPDSSWNNHGDFGSFPLDNRRVAYSTVINEELFIGFKYGPEVITINNDGTTNTKDTSDINDETIVGIKHHDGYYYVVTEESEVIRTSF